MKAFFFKSKYSEHGATLVEMMVSMGLIVTLAALVMPRFRSIEKAMNRMEARQTAGAIESELRGVLSDQQNVLYSAEKSNNSTIKNCLLSSSGSCSDNYGPLSMDFYMAGNSKPLTGESVRYSYSGDRCYGSSNCGPLKVLTNLRIFCSSGGYEKIKSCKSYSGLAMHFAIHDSKKNGKVISEGSVEMVSEPTELSRKLYLNCPKDHVLRGIGINGQAVCTKFADIKYQGTEGRKAGAFKVKRESCVPPDAKKQAAAKQAKDTLTVAQNAATAAANAAATAEAHAALKEAEAAAIEAASPGSPESVAAAQVAVQARADAEAAKAHAGAAATALAAANSASKAADAAAAIPPDPNDSFFLKAIEQDGKLTCKNKDW